MGFLGKLTHNLTYYKDKAIGSSSKPISDVRAGVEGVNLSSQEEVFKGNESVFSGWMFTARLGQPRMLDIPLMRKLEKSYPVQMVLNTFKKQVYTTKYDLVLDEDYEDLEIDSFKDDILKIKQFLKKVDEEGKSIHDLINESLNDIGSIDGGAWNKVYSVDSYQKGAIDIYDYEGNAVDQKEGWVLKPFGKRKLVRLHSVDGGSVLKEIDIHKNLLGFWQYSFKYPFGAPQRFSKDEMIYFYMNKSAHSVYGFGVIESIQQVLECLIQGTRHNKDLFLNNTIPDALVSLPNIPVEDLKRLKRMFNESVRQNPHQVSFINWDASAFHQLTQSNKDMEWLGGQEWYIKIVFGMYNVSSTECGFFENANRSNDDGQERVTVRNALKPYFKLYEDVLNNHIIPEILQKETPLRYRFTPKDHTAERIEFEQDMAKLDRGIMTINEYRRKNGEEDVEWGDDPLKKPFNPETDYANFGGQSPNAQSNVQGQNNQRPGKDENSSNPPSSNEKKSLTKELDLLAGDDIVSEADDYSDFLFKTFNRFEKKVLAAIPKIRQSKSVNKTLGMFMHDLFNYVNTAAFAAYVKRFLKQDMKKGLESAEQELDMDIGFTKPFDSKLERLYSQQLNGYTINGRLWPGIKGVTKEIQAKVISVVQDGLQNDLSNKDIQKNIEDIFDGFSESRSAKIARTETTRILSETKILGYKESGLEGGKGVSVALDDRTSPICRRMHAKYSDSTIPLDSEFIDDETMKSFASPPFHVNCRSSVFFRPK